MSPSRSHIPVLLAEVVQTLDPNPTGIYVDATFGAGGYSRALLENKAGHVIALDRDPTAQKAANQLKEEYPQHFTFIAGRFGDMDTLLAQAGISGVAGVVMDIGVSSMQIDDAERGFSFQKDGPLDMRMEKEGISAADIVNTMDETQLANIIYMYGEERFSRRIAKTIVALRSHTPFTTTAQLAEVVRRCIPRSGDGIDPATRTFQALRIWVNDELGELERGLDAATRLLTAQGILAVVTFHSLEDRLVKQFFKKQSGQTARGSRYMPDALDNRGTLQQALYEIEDKRGVRAGSSETSINPRSRSARLRYGKRTPFSVPLAAGDVTCVE